MGMVTVLVGSRDCFNAKTRRAQRRKEDKRMGIKTAEGREGEIVDECFVADSGGDAA